MVNQIFTDPGNSIHIGDKGIFVFSIVGILILVITEIITEFFPGIKLLNHHSLAIRYATILILLIMIISLGVFDGSQFIYFQF